jgi:hypothetical protein
LAAQSPEAGLLTEGSKPLVTVLLGGKNQYYSFRNSDDTAWIEGEIQRAQQYPDQPYAGIGHALRRCIEKGVSPQDLTDIARGMQASLLFDLCYLLDDPAFTESELQDLAWGLFQVDSNGNPVPPGIGSLHESVLETDPTGREMRPPSGDAGSRQV